ncbi:hypothetical protein [Dactylosporangium sp. NPDC005555]|uniref:hypothetical protein n=1 Tax=Dactylosporangium sp. NPDC005555 TaxID=3154889 RepID=UPI0033AEC017
MAAPVRVLVIAVSYPVTPSGRTCSAGLVRWDAVEAADEVVGRAGEALHHAEHHGRNRVHLVDATPTTRDTRILA